MVFLVQIEKVKDLFPFLTNFGHENKIQDISQCMVMFFPYPQEEQLKW